jgi:hypothetical protein
MRSKTKTVSAPDHGVNKSRCRFKIANSIALLAKRAAEHIKKWCAATTEVRSGVVVPVRQNLLNNHPDLRTSDAARNLFDAPICPSWPGGTRRALDHLSRIWTAVKIFGMITFLALPILVFAQEEGAGARDVEIPNPMGAHTWFIIVAVGAFLAWCISYCLELHKESIDQKPQREDLLRQKEQTLNRIAELESQKESGTLSQERYDKEFKKAKARLSQVLERLGRNTAER